MINPNLITGISILMINFFVIRYCLSNYHLTKVKDYLLFVYIFIGGAFFGLYLIFQVFFSAEHVLPSEINYFEKTDSSFIFRVIYFFYMMSPPVTAALTVVYFSRSIWLNTPKKVNYPLTIAMVVNILMNLTVVVNKYQWLGMSKYHSMIFRSWIVTVPLYLTGILSAILIRKLSDPVVATPRIKNVTKLWKVAFTFAILTGIGKTIRDVLALIPGFWTPQFNATMTVFTNTTVAGSFLPVAIIVLLYPEGVLIFQPSMVRVMYLYSHIDMDLTPGDNSEMTDLQLYLVEALEKVADYPKVT